MHNVIEELNLKEFYKTSDNKLKCKNQVYNTKDLFKFLKKNDIVNEMEAAEAARFVFANLEEIQDKSEIDKESQNGIFVFVDNWIEQNCIEFDYKGFSFRNGNKEKLSDILVDICLDAIQSGLKDPKPIIGDYLSKIMRERRGDILEDFRELLSYKSNLEPEGLSQIDRFIDLVSNSKKRRLELDKIVLKHMIWLVKRKLYGLPVEYQMMLNLQGQTNSGKTTAIKKLFEHLEDIFYDAPDLKIVGDSNEFSVFDQNFIIFFDEMAGATRTDVAQLKKMITSEYINRRIIYTQVHDHLKNNSTFFSTSNPNLKNLIIDPTSARRYWEIECLDRPEFKANWESLDKINYEIMWNAIDQTKPSPILEVIEEISDIQHKNFRANSRVEQWVEWRNFEIYKTETHQSKLFLVTGTLPQMIKSFMDANNVRGKVPTKNEVRKEMMDLGFDTGKNEENRHGVWVYEYGEDKELQKEVEAKSKAQSPDFTSPEFLNKYKRK